MKTDISLPNLQQATQNALKAWYDPNPEMSPFDGLHIFQQIQAGGEQTNREATNQLLLQALETLGSTRPDEANLLRRYFLDGDKMQVIARTRNISEATIYRQKDEAVAQLARILHRRELKAGEQKQAVLEQRLEKSTYTELIGVEAHLDDLLQVITAPGAPWLIAIEGMGGLGKTSLADALARRVIRQQLFNNLGWVSARQYDFNPGRGLTAADLPAMTAENMVEKLLAQLLPDPPRLETLSFQAILAMLQTRLRQRPHLIVVDNLETLVDLEALLPTLRNLANPTKFLLTTRKSLLHEHGLYHFPLPELSRANTLRLIRYEAALHNSPYLQNAADGELGRIVDLVGGNPLAVRLVVGQTHVYSLDVILNDLARARGQTIENLYSFIYRQAWDTLDELTRRVLLAMPLVAPGEGTLDHLAELSGLPPVDLRRAVNWLVTLNLIDRSGTLTNQHYSIHNLTRTFLQEQVLRWS